ncbi:MAG TPA: PRC-barrel domain-containing protein [Acetobacteraceae bacterium]
MSKSLLAALILLAGPALAQQAAAPAIPGVVATTNNPNLAVSAVRLESGQRLSQIIGASVFNDAGERIGGIDDLVMVEGDKVSVAIIGIGGFLGMGAKLVAVPYQQLKRDGEKLVLPGVTKDALDAMPSFSY